MSASSATLIYVSIGTFALGAVCGVFGDHAYPISRPVLADLQIPAFSASAAPAPVPPAPAPAVAAAASPVEMTLEVKGFKERDPQNRDFEDDITFGLTIKNIADKDIRAIDGLLVFTDLLDNHIYTTKFVVNDNPIRAGVTVNWNGGIQYNMFIEEHKRLRATMKDNLKMTFSPRKVLFTDGTTREFELPSNIKD